MVVISIIFIIAYIYFVRKSVFNQLRSNIGESGNKPYHKCTQKIVGYVTDYDRKSVSEVKRRLRRDTHTNGDVPVDYSYQVGSVEHKGYGHIPYKAYFNHIIPPDPDRLYLRSRIKIYYNPDEPSESCTAWDKKSDSPVAIIAVIAVLVAVLIGTA